MSRAGAKAGRENARKKRELAALDELERRCFSDQLAETILARCDGCGLVQVVGYAPTVCVVCGSRTGMFVERLALVDSRLLGGVEQSRSSPAS